jgi:hypothetical protein
MKFLIIFSLTINLCCLNAQHYPTISKIRNNEILKIHPLGFLNKAKVGYEYAHNTELSFGLEFALFYFLFEGYRISPFTRLYFSESCPKGFYFQIQGFFFNIKNKIVFKDNTSVTNSVYYKKASGLGGGVGLGYQFIFGKSQNVSLDIMLGLKNLPVSERAYYAKHITSNGEIFEIDNTSLWYLIGPGSFLNNQICIGLMF